ncbi:MAG: carboxypeptidase regulatory-like domain-containing protein, partial [bacterium]
YVMTSTESRGKTVKMWDIRDLDNPVLLDEYLAATSLAHNVHIRGDYAYISHYADGLRIVDIAEPAHVVEVGYYDTNPSNSSNFDGCWGAYPFTNSGYIYASDQEFGLFVIEFNGRRASRIKGRVLDSETGEVIASAHVEVVGGSQVVTSSADGEYKLGFSEPGTYVLRAYRAEYDTTTVTLTLAEGESRVQDFFLSRQPTTSVSGGPPLVPETYRLEQNYPNPFNAGTVIRYGLPAQTHVRLKVYDMLGKEVALLLDKIQPGGQHQVRWDGRNNAGQDVPSAVYFYRIQTKGLVQVNKMILIK